VEQRRDRFRWTLGRNVTTPGAVKLAVELDPEIPDESGCGGRGRINTVRRRRIRRASQKEYVFLWRLHVSTVSVGGARINCHARVHETLQP
jgi:hypothetical protein